MERFINDVNTAFDNKHKQNTIQEVMSHIELMLGISTSADRLSIDDETQFFATFVSKLRDAVSSHRTLIVHYVNKKISEVSDTQTE